MMDEDTTCRSRILVVDQETWAREFLTSVIKLCGKTVVSDQWSGVRGQ